MRPCFNFSAAATEEAPATLSIFDEIGFWGVQAKDFRDQLNGVKSKVLNVEINSPGGDVFDALAIYNLLKASGKEIVVTVMGVAASAASLIAMAGDQRIMPKNSFLMIHNPWSFAMGNADELRDTADTLEKIGNSLKATYVAATGMKDEDIAAMLATDTWLTAEESLEHGFATSVIDEIKVSARFDMARADLPANVRASYEPTPVVETEAQKADRIAAETETARLAQLARDEAAQVAASEPAAVIKAKAIKAGHGEQTSNFLAIALAGADEAKITARLAAATEVKALCAFAGRTADADQFIRADKPLADVKAALLSGLAEDDVHTSQARKVSPTPSGASSGVSPESIWDKRRQQQSARKGN